MIPGTPVTLLDGEEYLVPPLTWQQAHDLAPAIMLVLATQYTASSAEALDGCLAVALAALNRNYPMITKEQLIPLIDMPCCLSLFSAALTTTRPKPVSEPVFMMPPADSLPN